VKGTRHLDGSTVGWNEESLQFSERMPILGEIDRLSAPNATAETHVVGNEFGASVTQQIQLSHAASIAPILARPVLCIWQTLCLHDHRLVQRLQLLAAWLQRDGSPEQGFHMLHPDTPVGHLLHALILSH